MTAETPVYTETAYRSEFKPTWCPGCGDFAVLSAASKALADLQVPPEQVVIVSGIGCSSRIPYFFRTYGIHGLHGRSLPLATGVKLARPDLKVLVCGGDGDLFSIGTNHLIHAARRNLHIAVVLMDNQIYGLTKAQFSPTSIQRQISRSSPYGKVEPALNPVLLALSVGATYVARSFSARPRHVQELLAGALRHKGFGFIHVISPCREWHDRSAYYREHAVDIGQTHDVKDLGKALLLAAESDREHMGLFYQVAQPTFDEGEHSLVEKQMPFDLQEHLAAYR